MTQPMWASSRVIANVRRRQTLVQVHRGRAIFLRTSVFCVRVNYIATDMLLSSFRQLACLLFLLAVITAHEDVTDTLEESSVTPTTGTRLIQAPTRKNKPPPPCPSGYNRAGGKCRRIWWGEELLHLQYFPVYFVCTVAKPSTVTSHAVTRKATL